MARKVTAQEVADLAGVSRSAVSLVLNGRAAGNISAEKQKAVITAAQHLHYTPNAVAVSLRSQRTQTLGVLSWSGRGALAQALLHGAWHKAHELRYLLLMMDTDEDRDQEQQQLETLRNRQVDGYLIIAPDLTEYEPTELLLSVPTVLVNCVDPEAALSSVAPDEVQAGREAAQLLLRHGHEQVALLTGHPDSLQTRLRVLGVDQAFAAAGLAAPVPLAAGIGIDDGYRAASRLLEGRERPSALICTHERLAVGAVLAAAAAQVEIPAALSVVSLEDGEELARSLVPPVTTIHRPDAAMADQAVELLVAQLNAGPEPELRQLLFRCPVSSRSSVAAPGR